MRWVLVALLLLPTVAAAPVVEVGSPVGNPVFFAPQIVCSIVVSTAQEERCDAEGFVTRATNARFVIEGQATARFYVDDATSAIKVQSGDGTCSVAHCVANLTRPFTGLAELHFKATGVPGAVATIWLDRQSS